MSDSLREVVYTPHSPLRRPRQFVRGLWHDLCVARELAWLLFVRNLRAQYRQSALGYAWALVPPLVTTVTWVFLNAAGVLRLAPTSIPYPVYVLAGTVLWQAFVDALNSPLTQLVGNRALLSKVNFPREALILAGLGEVVFNLMIRFVLLLAVLISFRMAVPPTIVLVPVGLVVLLSMGLGIGLLLAPLSLLYQDVSRGLAILISLWFLATPIVYIAPTTGVIARFIWLNPITPLLVTTREWLLYGTIAQPLTFLFVACLAFLCAIAGWAFLRLAMPHVIARSMAR